MLSCNTIIEDFLAANSVPGEGERHRYALRQVLHALVRQAKSEHMAEVRRHAERAMRMSLYGAQRRRLRGEAEANARLAQRELEFDGHSDCDRPS